MGLKKKLVRSLKMKRIAVLLLVLTICLWSLPVGAGRLNPDKVLSNVYERLKKENKIDQLKPEHLSLERKIPIKLGDLSLWAVRIQIRLKSPDKQVRTATLDMVTDDNGQWQFEGLSDLKTGYPLLEKTFTELGIVKIESRMGQVTFRGKGSKTVVMVTDNFCPYCREAHKKLPGVYAKKIKELILIYLPLNKHPGAELACSISAYVYNRKDLAQYAKDVDDFIFQELPPPSTKDVNEANTAVYNAFKSKFPWFAREFPDSNIEKVFEKLRKGSNIIEQMRYANNLGLKGTPTTFINGRGMYGIDWEKFERFLTY